MSVINIMVVVSEKKQDLHPMVLASDPQREIRSVATSTAVKKCLLLKE
jgi:hypothetical protein